MTTLRGEVQKVQLFSLDRKFISGNFEIFCKKKNEAEILSLA